MALSPPSIRRGLSVGERGAPIVIVEDDDSMRRAVERLLRIAGYETRAYPSGEALLATDAARGAACLVCDIHLPGLSGLELQARLVAGGLRSPVVFITAHDSPAARGAAARAGALGYLSKPFAGRDLLEAVAKAFV